MSGLPSFSLGGLDLRIHLVWLILLAIALAIRGERRRRRALAVFLREDEAARTFAPVARRRRIRTALLGIGLLLLLFAALQPRSNPVKVRAPAKVRDLVVLLDVSRSMLATDRKPNRLESVKLELLRLADHLGGDRVGLVAFAGDSVVVCPLTSNYSYFKEAVRNLTTRTAGQGGTKIGDAIRKAAADLLYITAPHPAKAASVSPAAANPARRTLKYADLLLLTDGEDHDSYPRHAVRNYLAGRGVGLFIIGVGNPRGAPIRVGADYLRYHGRIVRSALQDKALRELVVEADRGRYLPAGVHHFDLVEFYEKAIRKDRGREVIVERVEWQEVFQPFLLAGLLFVLLAFLWPVRPSGRGGGR